MGFAEAALDANGPEGGVLDWEAIDWRTQTDNVRKLRHRIFKASQDEDLKKVRNLQKLMLRSRANTLLSVRQVTQVNAGRKTAGVDGKRALTSEARVRLAKECHTPTAPRGAKPVKRVYIPKANGKLRPLGIPAIADRVRQARVRNALEPEWEARFEPKSYGFRPGRSCHDAVEALFSPLRGANPHRTWILDADLTAAFDKINHDQLMAKIGHFPAAGMINAWLKAGTVDKGRYSPTSEGTPQGGVISPLLLNISLHGLEAAAGVRYRGGVNTSTCAPGSPLLVRYADDLVVLCHTRDEAEQVKKKLAAWLSERGLSFNEEKTRIVNAKDGFDFLGFNVRRYSSGKLLIKPSDQAMKKIRLRLKAEFGILQGTNAMAVIRTINPIVRGWSAYYRSAVSADAYSALDRYLWEKLYKWAKRSHANKPRTWTVNRYFGKFHPGRNDKWVFGDHLSGSYLLKFSWTKIVRHRMVKHGASPDDPELAEYWDERRSKRAIPHGTKAELAMASRQRGACPLCGLALISGTEYEPDNLRQWIEWFDAMRKRTLESPLTRWSGRNAAGRGEVTRLVHAECGRRNQSVASVQASHAAPP
uniref:group II intron reverse transcriptase/maturase n=1 Tax=Amycolatopsis sp. CA-096443 TaxID=3239919 RepID=UPI003F4935A3